MTRKVYAGILVSIAILLTVAADSANVSMVVFSRTLLGWRRTADSEKMRPNEFDDAINGVVQKIAQTDE